MFTREMIAELEQYNEHSALQQCSRRWSKELEDWMNELRHPNSNE